jgi:uncharacterized LabA/DUF88 family protein
MRSHCGVYVDAGYLLASAATRVTGTSLRNGITVEYPQLIASLIAQAERLAGLPVLRVHWYDAADNGIPDPVQDRLGLLPKVKLRLGRFGFDGQQKGVDLRIGLDMVAHARNNAVDSIVLVSGDDDLTEAVEEAQVHGVEVIVLAVSNREGQAHGVSRHLQRAADNLELLDPTAIETAVSRTTTPTTPPVPSIQPAPVPARSPSPTSIVTPSSVARVARPQPSESVAYSGTAGGTSTVAPEFALSDEELEELIHGVAKKVLTSFLASATPEDLADFEYGRPSIPRELDRALLVDLSDALNTYNLSDGIRTQLRRQFWEIADAQSK